MIEVFSELENSSFRITVKKKGPLNDVDLFAEVRCNSFEAKKDFVLVDEAQLIFDIPDLVGENKIYYGIYFSSGKAIYLNSYLLEQGEDGLDVSMKIIEAGSDKDSYVDGESVLLNWKIDSQDTFSTGLIAELVGPDDLSNKIIDEDIYLEEGQNILDKEINPEFTKTGLYRILYKFVYEESVLAQGSIFFDVGQELSIELLLDKREYMQDEDIELTACIFSSSTLSGDLTVFLDGQAIETRSIDLDGYTQVDFTTQISDPGQYQSHVSLFYNNTKLESDSEGFEILAPPEPNHSPVLFTIGDREVLIGGLLEFFVEAMDIDGDELLYSVEGLPDGASFDPVERKFSWAPDYNQIGEYFVTFVVTDGEDSASERIKIVVYESMPSPEPVPLAEPLSGMAPLEVYFSADGVTEENIVKYEWDFDGKGVYDYSSLESGDAIFVYTCDGNFPATLRVTDDEGNTNIYTVTINIKENPDAPRVYLDANPLNGIAPCKVHFKGSVVSSASICRYEWDFNGDGVYDARSYASAEVVKTYYVPGTYNAELRVTNSEGLSDSQSVLIEIFDPSVLSIELVISADSNTVPAEVDFDALVDSENEIQKYQWDFEGDGIFDFTSNDSPKAKNIYYRPGLYRPTLRVTDENNISVEASKKIRFRVFDISKIIIGRLVANPRKGEAPLTVLFSFKAYRNIDDAKYYWDFDGDGICDLVTTSKDSEFTYYDSGVYMAEVKVKSTHGFRAKSHKMIYVRKGKGRGPISSILDKGKSNERKKVFKDKLDKVELFDKTSLIKPAGILDADDMVDVSRLEETEISKEIILDQEERIISAGEYREYKFEYHKGGFNKEMIISIPYLDEDEDGIVDGKGIDERTLDVYWFDEEEKKWKVLSDVLIFHK